MKKTFNLALLLIFSASHGIPVAAQDSDKISGRYVQIDHIGFELILGSNSSFLYYQPNGAVGTELRHPSDTIAYGKWSSETNGWLALSSPASLSEPLKILITESKVQNQDTVFVRINNPMEERPYYADPLDWTVKYYADVRAGTPPDTTLQQLDETNLSNVLKFYNPKTESIVSIKIVIYIVPQDMYVFVSPLWNGGPRVVKTEKYLVKNSQSNRFTVDIPDMTEGFLKYRRLNRDFVKIINETELEWDGHIFKKQSN